MKRYFKHVFLFSMDNEVVNTGIEKWSITCLLCVGASYNLISIVVSG